MHEPQGAPGAANPTGPSWFGWTARRGVRGALLAMALMLPAAPDAIAAQEVSDSLRQVIQERLERLARRVGDSTGLRPDSLADRRDEAGEGGDSLLIELLELPGYGLTQYRSSGARFDPRMRIWQLLGNENTNAVLIRDGRELAADTVIFDDNTGRLVTFGDEANYQPENGNEIVAQRLIFDLNEDRGTANDARTEMGALAGSWKVHGDFPWVGQDLSYGQDLSFTSCPDSIPHYHFVASNAKLSQSGMLIARNVFLHFGDVPVFWLPFLAQSTEQGRRSGLLPVRFSVNDIVRTSDTYSRRVSNIGYYWAINEYADAQAGLDWWSGNYTGVTGALQYRWLRMGQDGRAEFRQFWRDNGGSELAFNTTYNWELSERTRMRLRASYASSSSFVRQNSFDPREVTQSIDSDGGFDRRFDWGQLSLAGNRRQFLSDDRVEMTLPTLSLSLSTMTLFPAPPNRARFYNNMTVSASARGSRSIRDLPAQNLAENPFSFGLADTENWRGTLSGTVSAGALSISQNVNYGRNSTLDVPAGFFDPASATAMAGVGSVADLQRPAFFPATSLEGGAFNADELTWSTTINYQRSLVGSTTLTPHVSLSGRSINSDTLSVGNGFVAAPTRVAIGAQLKSDIYGFYGGGNVRHKISPSFDYAFTPRTDPTDIQAALFGPRGAQPRNELRIGLNQTIEARVGDPQTDSTAEQEAPDREAGPRRLPQSRKVMVLAWRTSAVTYDFEQAGELGHYTRGFADNLTIQNQFSSDLIRGLNVSIDTDVFDDSGVTPEGGQRKFSLFVSSMNLSFSLNNRSGLMTWLGGLGRGRGGEAPDSAEAAGGETGAESGAEEEPEEDQQLFQQEETGVFGAEEDPFADPTGFETEDMGEATVVPGRGRSPGRAQQSRRRGGVGDWNASISYSLSRNRGVDFGGSQMLQTSLAFDPTEKWSVRWRSSYDVQAGVFNDHTISLERDLHRWDANFSFRQTPTGNWSFVFEVALSDNRDLHFDYEQRTALDRQRR
ncbi:MAG: putative LPS assembly protein LptD [Gemmatimonadetes bacterium]|nr:putative LPS assembly protein LptD [Gemmatimonadota bacterium]